METDDSKLMKTVASEAGQMSDKLHDLKEKNTAKTDLLTVKISEAEKILCEALQMIVENTHLNSLKEKNEMFFNVTDDTYAQLEEISLTCSQIQGEIKGFERSLNTGD